ncbi:hypothetical protein Tco_1446538 [Tanacetum coccineum]
MQLLAFMKLIVMFLTIESWLGAPTPLGLKEAMMTSITNGVFFHDVPKLARQPRHTCGCSCFGSLNLAQERHFVGYLRIRINLVGRRRIERERSRNRSGYVVRFFMIKTELDNVKEYQISSKPKIHPSEAADTERVNQKVGEEIDSLGDGKVSWLGPVSTSKANLAPKQLSLDNYSVKTVFPFPEGDAPTSYSNQLRRWQKR